MPSHMIVHWQKLPYYLLNGGERLVNYDVALGVDFEKSINSDCSEISRAPLSLLITQIRCTEKHP